MKAKAPHSFRAAHDPPSPPTMEKERILSPLNLVSPIFVFAILTLGVVPLVFFAFSSGGTILPDAYAWRVLRFTFLQAALSTCLSVIPAIFVARALARRKFFGRDALVALFSVPLSLPVIVAIFGVTALFGANGVLKGWMTLYGLGGIIFCHVFFNLPLATRLLLESLNAAPADAHRLAAQLNFDDLSVLKHLDWPMLQSALPRVSALVFLLCTSSFVIVLLLGGPQATTLEVAIYQSLRMDFDVTRALTLTFMQVLLSVVLVWAAAKALVKPVYTTSTTTSIQRYDGQSIHTKLLDVTAILGACFLVIPVLASVFLQGIFHLELNFLLLRALLTSFVIATLSCAIALPLAWSFAQLQIRKPKWRGIITGLSLAGFIVPPAVIATGWFLVFRSFDGGLALAVTLIAIMNALMALPFLMTVIAPAVARLAQQHDRLCAQLNIYGWNRLRVVDVPALRGPFSQALLMTVVLSMGDLTAVTLLGTQGLLTLPSLAQQQMGHYQSEAAGGTALVLAMLCLLTTLLAQRMAKWT